MAVAADVPGKFDLVLNGEGYVCADMEEVKAQFGYTPTFVARTNVQGDYGDNTQDFWMTFTQRDWSLGEQQKFYRQDEPRSPRYWRGSNVGGRTAGQVPRRPKTTSPGFGASVFACR